MDDLIHRARGALVNVTPGPWHHDGHTGVMASGSVDTYGGPVWATIIRAEQTSEMDGDGRSWETSGDPDANARFISVARNLVPAMAARLEAQEALLREAMAALQWLREVTEPPDRNCSCHLSPPCGWCEEHAAVAEAHEETRATLAKLRSHLEESK